MAAVDSAAELLPRNRHVLTIDPNGQLFARWRRQLRTGPARRVLVAAAASAVELFPRNRDILTINTHCQLCSAAARTTKLLPGNRCCFSVFIVVLRPSIIRCRTISILLGSIFIAASGIPRRTSLSCIIFRQVELRSRIGMVIIIFVDPGHTSLSCFIFRRVEIGPSIGMVFIIFADAVLQHLIVLVRPHVLAIRSFLLYSRFR
mmetsp:Transcript_30699/g.102151  ORF Transcript_30699/g.102151 Transcript_30699/m.102151 type:complete len:204 (+) Transcript_30699:395-1006(+)